MKRMIKFKNLPKTSELKNIRFRNPQDKKLYWWYSQWQIFDDEEDHTKLTGIGIWAKRDLNDTQVFPLTFTLEQLDNLSVINTMEGSK